MCLPGFAYTYDVEKGKWEVTKGLYEYKNNEWQPKVTHLPVIHEFKTRETFAFSVIHTLEEEDEDDIDTESENEAWPTDDSSALFGTYNSNDDTITDDEMNASDDDTASSMPPLVLRAPVGTQSETMKALLADKIKLFDPMTNNHLVDQYNEYVAATVITNNAQRANKISDLRMYSNEGETVRNDDEVEQHNKEEEDSKPAAKEDTPKQMVRFNATLNINESPPPIPEGRPVDPRLFRLPAISPMDISVSPPKPPGPFWRTDPQPTPIPRELLQDLAQLKRDRTRGKAKNARRDGMRLQRAQHMMHARHWKEPALTLEQAYERVLDEEWRLGWYIDGTPIPDHPMPRSSFPGFSTTAPSPRPASLLDESFSSIGNDDPLSLYLSFEQNTSENENDSLASFTNTNNLHHRYVPTDHEDMDDSQDDTMSPSHTITLAAFDYGKWLHQPDEFLSNENYGETSAPAANLTTVDQSVEDTPVEEYVEIDLAKYQWEHQDQTPRTKRASRESPKPNHPDSALLHIFLGMVLSLLFLLPGIPWLCPIPTPVHVGTPSTLGLSYLLNSTVYFEKGYNNLSKGIYELMTAILLHPFYKYAFIVWTTCWLIVGSYLLLASNKTKNPGRFTTARPTHHRKSEPPANRNRGTPRASLWSLMVFSVCVLLHIIGSLVGFSWQTVKSEEGESVQAKRNKRRIRRRQRKQQQKQQFRLACPNTPTPCSTTTTHFQPSAPAMPAPRPLRTHPYREQNIRNKQFSPNKPRASHFYPVNTQEAQASVYMAVANEDISAPLQAPTKLRNAMPPNASYPIIWDSGASISISCRPEDFVEPVTPVPRLKIKGISKDKIAVVGKGTVLWNVLDTNGNLRSLKLPALLVPKAKTRLLSVQSLLQKYNGEKIEQDGTKLTLSGLKDDKTRGPVCVRVNTLNNLPMSYGYDMGHIHTSTQALTSIVQTTSIHNHNLAEPAKELLRWHERLGHLGFKKVQFLLRTGILATSESTRRLHTAAANLTILPLCAACQYGKQKRRPSPGITHKLVKDRNTITNKIISTQDNASQWIISTAPQKAAFSHHTAKPKMKTCMLEAQFLSTTRLDTLGSDSNHTSTLTKP